MLGVWVQKGLGWARALPSRGPIGIWIFAAGTLATLGFAPFGLWFFGVFSLAILWVCIRHAQTPKQAAGAAFVWGLGHTLTALYWLPWAFYKDADGSWLAAIGGGVPAMVGLAIYSTLGPVLASFLAAHAQKRWVYLGAPVFLAVWVGLEFLKGLSPYGFPWLPVGAMWATHPWLVQGASVGGVWLLSALILGLAMLVSQPTRVRVVLAVACLGVIAAAGAYRISKAPVVELNAPRIRLVQPNIQSEHKWDPVKRWAFLNDTLDTAFGSSTEGRLAPATVVLPENAIAFFITDNEDVQRTLANRIPLQSTLVAGTARKEPNPNASESYPFPLFYNSMAVVTSHGLIAGLADKHLLVPFGEFIPLRNVLNRLPLPVPLRTLSQSRLDYIPGTRDPLLPTPAGKAVGLICYEGIFPWYVARHARTARYLINVTNDNWFTGTIALYQHAALERLRAVETGLPLVRVANTGLTQVIDAYGRVVAQLPVNTASRVDVPLPPAAPPPYFLRLFQ